MAKALESEKLLKEAEEARLAHAARKEREAAESRYDRVKGGARGPLLVRLTNVVHEVLRGLLICHKS